MEAHQIPATVVSTVLTIEDVLSAAGGELSQEQFAILASAAKDDAVKTSGVISKKWEVFRTNLLANCEKFGDKIPRNFVLVAEGNYPAKAYFLWANARLTFWANGSDGYLYSVAVYPN